MQQMYMLLAPGGQIKPPVLYTQFILQLLIQLGAKTKVSICQMPTSAGDSTSLMDKPKLVHLLPKDLPQSHTHTHINQKHI